MFTNSVLFNFKLKVTEQKNSSLSQPNSLVDSLITIGDFTGKIIWHWSELELVGVLDLRPRNGREWYSERTRSDNKRGETKARLVSK